MENPQITKKELRHELSRLREVSQIIEDLTKKLSTAPDLKETARIKVDLDNYSREQSRIVDKFLNLSRNESLKKDLNKKIREINDNTKRLVEVDTEKEIELLRKKLFSIIDEWISILEKIMMEVISQAP